MIDCKIIEKTLEWVSCCSSAPSTSRVVRFRWDDERRKACGKNPIDDCNGYYCWFQDWWVSENGESPNKSYPHQWKDLD